MGVININNNDGNVVKGHPGIVEINGANNGNPHDSDDDGESDEDINETPSFNNMIEDGMGDGEENDDDFEDPSGRGAGDAIPEAIPPEPGFIEKISLRFNQILADENPNFNEFCSVTDDFLVWLKKELNFKTRVDDGAVRPPKQIDPKNPTDIKKLYRRNRKKALRLTYNEESDFCDLDPEEVANHYNTVLSDKPHSTEFMIEGEPAGDPMNTSPFTRNEVSKKLKTCENTSPGPDGITYQHLKIVDPNAVALMPLYSRLKFKAVLEENYYCTYL